MTAGCPICQSQTYSVVYDSTSQYAEGRIVKCSKCSHAYTLLGKAVDTESLYTDSDEVYRVVDNRTSIFYKILNLEYNSVIRKLRVFHKQKGSLLDFGSGKGKFAKLAQQDGWTVKCVETSPDRADYAKKIYGLDVNSDFYSSGRIFDTGFDVITLFHVLEHLPQPTQLLSQLVQDNANPGATVIIEVPNFSSLQSSLAKNKWIHLDVPRHLSHFTPATLEQVIKACQMSPVKSNYFSFHLGVLGMVDSLLKLVGYKGNIIFELKNKKRLGLIAFIVVVLPVALLLEALAAAFGKGGIVRIYCTLK